MPGLPRGVKFQGTCRYFKEDKDLIEGAVLKTKRATVAATAGYVCAQPPLLHAPQTAALSQQQHHTASAASAAEQCTTPFHKHALTRGAVQPAEMNSDGEEQEQFCDNCDKALKPLDTVYSCAQCDYDLCAACKMNGPSPGVPAIVQTGLNGSMTASANESANESAVP